MTFPRLWAFLAVALPVLAALVATLSTVDLAYQIRAGQQVLDGLGIPTVDSWTFTASGAPWNDQQWAAQVVLGLVFRVAGWVGLVVARAALVGVIFGCVLEIGRSRGLGLRRSAWLTLAAFVVAAPALGLRPQLLGMALFALSLVLVGGRRAHPRRLWLVPCIVLVWANVHGSFFLGPLVLGLAWLEDRHDRHPLAQRTLAAAVTAAVAACVTPSGPAVWAYALGLSTNPVVTAQIAEWQPASLRDGPGILFFGSVALVVALFARQGRPVPWPTLAWIGIFFAIGAYAVRGVAWWPLGAAFAVSGFLASGIATPGDSVPAADAPRVARLNAAIAAIVVVVGLVLIPWWRPVDAATGAPSGTLADAPPGMTAALRTIVRPDDRLYNPQHLGSWIEFALPDLKVAVDSRIELFPPSVWDDYDRVAAGGEGWLARLASWGVTVVAATEDQRGFVGRLSEAGWRTAYSATDGTILLAPGR